MHRILIEQNLCTECKSCVLACMLKRGKYEDKIFDIDYVNFFSIKDNSEYSY